MKFNLGVLAPTTCTCGDAPRARCAGGKDLAWPVIGCLIWHCGTVYAVWPRGSEVNNRQYSEQNDL